MFYTKTLLARIMDFFMSFWRNMPDTAKEKIIDAIVEAFTEMFKAFYKEHQKQQEAKSHENK